MDLIGDAWSLLTSWDSWTGPRGIFARGQAHIWISLVATLFSALLAVPLALWLAHRRIAPVVSVAVVNVARAIPSFALVALVLPFSIRFGFGLGFWPTCVALVALGIPPMFANTYAGVAETPDSLVEAARGIGMTDFEILTKVEIPSALPLLLTGVRISSVQIVATATLGAIVGYECLGSFIVSGLARGKAGQPSVLVGAILVAVLALSLDYLLGRLLPRFAPWTRQASSPALSSI